MFTIQIIVYRLIFIFTYYSVFFTSRETKNQSSCRCNSSYFFFFFKQKTAYEVGTGDWSSDVCSSDLGRKTHVQMGYLLLLLVVDDEVVDDVVDDVVVAGIAGLPPPPPRAAMNRTPPTMPAAAPADSPVPANVAPVAAVAPAGQVTCKRPSLRYSAATTVAPPQASAA